MSTLVMKVTTAWREFWVVGECLNLWGNPDSKTNQVLITKKVCDPDLLFENA